MILIISIILSILEIFVFARKSVGTFHGFIKAESGFAILAIFAMFVGCNYLVLLTLTLI